MTTDSERRAVARRLRSFVTDDSVYAVVDACRVLHSVGLYYKDIDRIYFSGFDVARLADLIEPGDTSQSCRDSVACDRDALLGLAEDVDGAAEDSGGFEPLAGMLRDIARRIREALGVES